MKINLHAKNMIVTRPGLAGAELCERIEENGGKALHFPTLAFAPPSNMSALYEALTVLAQQAYLIFISPQAVYHCLDIMNRLGVSFPPAVVRVAIGAGTALALEKAGYAAQCYPEQKWDSESVLDLPLFQSVAHKKIAVIRGEGGRQWIDKILTARGAMVLPVIVYSRVLPQLDKAPLIAMLKYKTEVIVSMSFESIRNLTLLVDKIYHPLLKQIPLLVGSERIKTLAENLGFQTIWVAKNTSVNATLQTLSEKIEQN